MRRKKDYKILEEQCLGIIREQNVLSMNGIAAFLDFPFEKFLDSLFKLLASEEERKVMGGAKKDDSAKEENSTKEAYLKSLEEMGKEIDAD